MDRSTHVTLGGFLAGLAVGFGAGWLWAVFRRAWRDLGVAQRGTAAYGRTAWARTGDLLALGFLLTVVAALILGGVLER